MSCLGVHFAITAEEEKRLRAFADEQDRLSYVREELEEYYLSNDEQFTVESDKSWDAMHRALADGKLSFEGGEYPLNLTVLGGESLYADSDYIMSLKTPRQVRDIAAKLLEVTETTFRQGYNAIDTGSYQGELSDEDFEYTWTWFQQVRAFYTRAAQVDRFVLFTADQ